jgi:predicted KAP-like P-loop ATPase
MSTRIGVFISTLRTHEIYSEQIEELLAIKSRINNKKPIKKKEWNNISRWLDKVITNCIGPSFAILILCSRT